MVPNLILFKSLFKSSTIYRNINCSYPYDKQESYYRIYDSLRGKGLGKDESDKLAKDTIKDGYMHIIVDEDLYDSSYISYDSSTS